MGLKGRVDASTSQGFERRLIGLVRQGETRLILDFQDLDYISSAGLRVLLLAVKELKACNGRLLLCSLKDYIKEIFEMSGFASFLPIHPSLEEGLKAV